LRRGGGVGLGPEGTPAGFLDFAEVQEGAVVSALKVLAAALQAGEGVRGVLEGFAEHLVFSLHFSSRMMCSEGNQQIANEIGA
jgi:hypothetical protein